MYIEDLIISLAVGQIRINLWDQKVVSSFYSQICQGSGFTEKQSTLALRIIKRYQVQLHTMHNKDILPLIDSPQYRLQIRKSVSTRSIRIIDGDEYYTRVIEVKFPYSEEIITEIRKYRNSNPLSHASWNKEKSAWIFTLSEEHIVFLMTMFKDEEFDMDEEFENYRNQISEIIANMDQYVPMLAMSNNVPTIINKNKFIPYIDEVNLLGSIFKARTLGINHWEQPIDDFLDSIDDSTKNFLKSDLSKITKLKSTDEDILCLKNILSYLGPTLFIIPGVNEFEKLKNMHTILNEMNISNKDISVMFRLDSIKGKEFNEFVKSNLLNNPVSDETKAVFISGKIPKPLVRSNLKFNSIMNLGFSNAHYSLRDYAKNHQNLVFFDVESHQGDDSRGFNFVDM